MEGPNINNSAQTTFFGRKAASKSQPFPSISGAVRFKGRRGAGTEPRARQPRSGPCGLSSLSLSPTKPVRSNRSRFHMVGQGGGRFRRVKRLCPPEAPSDSALAASPRAFSFAAIGQQRGQISVGRPPGRVSVRLGRAFDGPPALRTLVPVQPGTPRSYGPNWKPRVPTRNSWRGQGPASRPRTYRTAKPSPVPRLGIAQPRKQPSILRLGSTRQSPRPWSALAFCSPPRPPNPPSLRKASAGVWPRPRGRRPCCNDTR